MRSYFFTALFVISCCCVHAQQSLQNSLDSFSGKFVTDIRTQKQKALLVTDKSVYYPGDNIWFNVFLLNNLSLKPSVRNKFLFVDLVNNNDSVIKVLVLDAARRQLNSRISLPDSMAQGYYRLRAYTREMAETDSSGVSVRSIYIVGKNSAASLSDNEAAQKDTAAPAVIFFPEGGNIITGIASNVALLVTDKQNNAVITNGLIKDGRNAVVASFSTNKYGLAKFSFEPSGYKQYRAVINWNGTDRNYPLPAFNFFNGQLSVTKYSGGYTARVLIGDSVYTKDYVSYVIGIARDSLFFASVGRGQYELNIPDEKLPQGIATLYLLNKNFALLSERSFYINNSVHVMATTDRQQYDKRDKVMLSVGITDANNHFIPAQLSVSVMDAAFADTALCNTDVKQPDNINLAENNCLGDNDVDLLMLTKTNTFYAKNTAAINAPAVYDSLLYVKGTILTDKGAPAENKVGTLVQNGKSVMLFTDTTDAQGRFSFPVDSYADNTQFSLSVADLNGHTQSTKIVLDSIHFPKLVTPASKKEYLQLPVNKTNTYFDSSYKQVLMSSGSGHMLTPVTVRNKKKITYDESKRVSGTSFVIPGDEIQENTKLGDALFKASGVHIVNGLLVIGSPTSMSRVFSEPLLVIDGYYVDFNSLGAPSETESTDPSPLLSYLSSINPKDVDFIEVLKGPEASNYGERGGNGVIIINTLKKRREVTTASNDLKVFTETGITNPVLFMNTDYQQKNVKVTQPDVRSTLFWNGNFTTDNTQAATINFYTADVAATYKIIITGITANGDFIYKTATFSVK